MTKGNLMPIILYMSVSDFFMNAASALGFPRDGTFVCWLQGISVNYFALCSWLWTTLLAYRVYCTIRYSKVNITAQQMNCIGWGLPAILILLPMITFTGKYGASESNSQWCLLQTKENTPDWLIDFWTYITIFAWLFVCIICMLTWQVLIMYHFRTSPVRAIVNRTYDKVYLYPVAMIVCWMLNFWCDAISTHSGGTLDALSMFFGISNGLLAALIFMVKSEEARRRWSLYLFPPARSRLEQLVEPTVRLDFEEEDGELEEGEQGGGGAVGDRRSPRFRNSSSAPAVVAATTASSSGSRPLSGRSVSMVSLVSDLRMSDLTVSTAGSSPLHSTV